MTMRPEDIKNRTFANALRGYDKDEVRSFLFKVAESSRELHEKLTATEEQVASAAAPAVVDGKDKSGPDRDGPSPVEGLDMADSSIDDSGSHDLVAAEAVEDDGSDSPVETLAAAEQSIVDRYEVLGDRIAGLLRSADESATDIRLSAERESAEIRAAAEADADRVRSDAEDHAAELLSEARAIRQEADNHRDEVMAGLAKTRLDEESALSDARATAEAEVETYRVDSIDEIQALRSTAAQDADSLRETAVAEGAAAIAEEATEASRLREEAESDRVVARSELEDVRAEVSALLEQARTQSEFIKQEADEIIRTKVRSSYEQAQARIDVLRNTETASRERIVRAQTELAGALTRLESEPAPALDASSAPGVIEEAERRHDELSPGSEVDDAETLEVLEVVMIDADAIETDVIDAELADDDDSIGREAFEADIAEATQQLDDEAEEDSLSDFFVDGSAAEPVTTSSILAGSFAPNVDVDTEPGDSEESPLPDRPHADFDVTEHVVVESSESGEERSSESSAPDASYGAASHVDASGSEVDAPEDGRTEEDALARLVREAMQEAVDSARKQD